MSSGTSDRLRAAGIAVHDNSPVATGFSGDTKGFPIDGLDSFLNPLGYRLYRLTREIALTLQSCPPVEHFLRGKHAEPCDTAMSVITYFLNPKCINELSFSLNFLIAHFIVI